MNTRISNALFENAGIDLTEAGKPFFKPDSRERAVRILALRSPSASERVKAIKKDGKETGDTLTLLAILDVEVKGNPHTWEVSSRRLLNALASTVKVLPAEVVVSVDGKGTDTTYTVKPYTGPETKRAPGTLGEKCDAPGCVGVKGHQGRHFTKSGETVATPQE